MPVTNSRQSAEWQARFNRVVLEILGPGLTERGYYVSLDQVTEDVEPDSYGPFYVGEVGFSRALPNGLFAHLVVQSTTQAGLRAHTFYVDLLRGPAPDPPNWLTGALGPTGAAVPTQVPGRPVSRRVGRPAVGAGSTPSDLVPAPSSQPGWEFRDSADLRQSLSFLRDYLLQGGPAIHPELPHGQSSRSLLDWLESPDGAAQGTR